MAARSVFLVAAVAALGCESTTGESPAGGADGAVAAGGSGSGGGSGGSGGAPDSGSDAGGGSPVCAAPQPEVSCPEPAAGTFDVAATGFENAPDDLPVQNPSIRHRVEDLLVNVPGRPTLTGRMARGRGLLTAPYSGEAVSLFTWDAQGAWLSLGQAATDDTGAFSVELPESAAFGRGSHDVIAVLEGDGTCARGGVHQWPAGTPVVLTDIDGTLTLSDTELLQQLSEPTYDPQQYPDADEMVRAWREKGYRIVYLTARPHDLRMPTEVWLRAHGYPAGPIITAESLVVGETAHGYKTAAIAHILGDLGWEIAVAYGNATSDIDAYADNALPLDRTFIIGESAGEGGTTAIAEAGYTAHLAAFVEPFAPAEGAYADEGLCLP